MSRAYAAQIGPKAVSLQRLADAGLPVPEARFLDCAEYRLHAAAAGVPGMLAATRAGIPLDHSRIAHAIVSAPLDRRVVQTLEAWHVELGMGPVAVRSSANAEDLSGASFAGQHGTYFASTLDELVARVRDCWASLFSERAVRYRERAGIEHSGVEMAVIVQLLVPAVAAGVAFTVDPVSGADDVSVEACLGIGESLVSGKVTPDRFAFARDGLTVRSRAIAPKTTQLLADTDGRVRERDVPASVADRAAVGDEVAREVAVLALRAEELFSVAIDIEWAYDGQRLWLLQARPITTLEGSCEPPVIWSNVNTGEILPDVITPLTWSLIHGHAEEIFGGMFGALGLRVDPEKLVGLVGGRVYFNLTTIRESFAAMPLLDVDRFLGGMQDYVDVPPPPIESPRRGGGRLRAAVSLPPYVLRHLPSGADRFAARLARSTDEALARLEARPSLAEAHRLFEELVELFDEFADGLAFMAVAMLGFGVLSGVCRSWLGDESGALANRLVAGRGDVSSAEAGLAMWQLAVLARQDPQVSEVLAGLERWESVRERLGGSGGETFVRAWEAFMADYGHHRRGELELHNPTWAEQPDYVLGIVRGYVAQADQYDPVRAYDERSSAADAAAQECAGRLGGPVRRAVFAWALRWGRSSAGARENIKSEAVRWLAAIRRMLLAIGEHLAAAGKLGTVDDVFFLTAAELAEVVTGGDGRDWRALVARRRAEHEHFETLSPPPVIVGEWDERSEGMRLPEGATVLRGISVSAGVARGPARVFAYADAEDAVLPGEILVAPFTDPGWTPYFIPAAGIVMDMGGVLSHGSIIAREYGIPAVVNVGPATRIIHTGDIIEVDGDRGEVRLVRESVPPGS